MKDPQAATSSQFDHAEHPHRRQNPLTGEWVLVSPHRAKRPWQGAQEAVNHTALPSHDPSCYLCPENTRINGETNPNYRGPFVFTNDFAAVQPDTPEAPQGSNDLFVQQSVRGEARVICFSPDHSRSLPELNLGELRAVVDCWAEQLVQLGQDYQWVQIFENKGEAMGCSNPHPHGQIWATDTLPTEAAKEDRNQRQWLETHGEPLLVSYLKQELALGERIVVQNEHWAVLVPFWATWPFETLLLPKRHVSHLDQLTGDERDALADILKRHLTRYDNLFQTSFPYSMGWHGAPQNAQSTESNQHWQLHAHFYPPLLRSASVKKFMVGFEMLGESQRDITPEQAAARLRELSEQHFRQDSKR